MSIPSSELPTQSAPPVANPAPLGLCAFALTTFVLSAANAKLFDGADVVIGLALFYGGIAQVLAGMWEFKTGNTFGATAFTSYGAFWLAVAASLQLKLIPNHPAFGFFLLGWTIFTFLLLTLGEFGMNTGQIGGYFGLATALVAWYTALAGLLASMPSAPFTLPVGPRA